MNIVFDLDGTLIDSAPDIQCLANSVLEPRGHAPLTLAETRQFIGAGSALFVSRMMAARQIPETPDSHAQLYAQFMDGYVHAVDKAVFYPDAVETLALLKAEGHRLGLCTNKPEHATRAVLGHMGMDTLFAAVMAGGMLESRKPEPAMLLQTIAALGGGATLYVGDSEIDAETAVRAQVPFALFTEGYRKAPAADLDKDWMFAEFTSLPDIVAEAARNTR